LQEGRREAPHSDRDDRGRQIWAMFPAQSKFIPRMQAVGVADLNLEKARSACITV